MCREAPEAFAAAASQARQISQADSAAQKALHESRQVLQGHAASDITSCASSICDIRGTILECSIANVLQEIKARERRTLEEIKARERRDRKKRLCVSGTVVLVLMCLLVMVLLMFTPLKKWIGNSADIIGVIGVVTTIVIALVGTLLEAFV